MPGLPWPAPGGASNTSWHTFFHPSFCCSHILPTFPLHPSFPPALWFPLQNTILTPGSWTGSGRWCKYQPYHLSEAFASVPHHQSSPGECGGHFGEQVMLGKIFQSVHMSCVVPPDFRDREQPLLGCKDAAFAGIILGCSLQGSSTPDFLLHLELFRQYLPGMFSVLPQFAQTAT